MKRIFLPIIFVFMTVGISYAEFGGSQVAGNEPIKITDGTDNASVDSNNSLKVITSTS